MISALWHKSKLNFKLFWRENQIFQFPCSSTYEDLSIDISITIVGLILTKIGWFQQFGTSQNSILTFFENKIIFLSFHAVASTRKELSIDVLIATVGLISMKPGWFLSSGYGQTDRTQFWNPHLETCRHTKNCYNCQFEQKPNNNKNNEKTCDY